MYYCPLVETMISDIVLSSKRPKLEIWYNTDLDMYCVSVDGEIWCNENLEWSIQSAWSYLGGDEE